MFLNPFAVSPCSLCLCDLPSRVTTALDTADLASVLSCPLRVSSCCVSLWNKSTVSLWPPSVGSQGSAAIYRASSFESQGAPLWQPCCVPVSSAPIFPLALGAKWRRIPRLERVSPVDGQTRVELTPALPPLCPLPSLRLRAPPLLSLLHASLLYFPSVSFAMLPVWWL